MSEPNGPSVYVPPEQRDDMLALINANRRVGGLLPQQYPGHDPYADISEFDTGCTDACPEDCSADHKGEE